MKPRCGVARHKAVKRIHKRSKGFWGGRGNLLRMAKETILKAENYATRDRKQKKRHFRSLWILRINAAVRAGGMRYNEFIAGLKSAGVVMNRKMLSELAIQDEGAFAELVKVARTGLAKAGKTE